MIERIAEIATIRKAVDELRGHPRNPRKHPEPGSKLWEILKRSLERSYFEPLVWNRRNDYLVSGHFRLKVLIELGYTHVDVAVVDLSEAEHLAVMVAANRTLGEWEETVLELFNGSGTTMAAAEQTGRRCVSTELDPKFVAVGLERMTNLGLQVEKVPWLE